MSWELPMHDLIGMTQIRHKTRHFSSNLKFSWVQGAGEHGTAPNCRAAFLSLLAGPLVLGNPQHVRKMTHYWNCLNCLTPDNFRKLSGVRHVIYWIFLNYLVSGIYRTLSHVFYTLSNTSVIHLCSFCAWDKAHDTRGQVGSYSCTLSTKWFLSVQFAPPLIYKWHLFE